MFFGQKINMSLLNSTELLSYFELEEDIAAEDELCEFIQSSELKHIKERSEELSITLINESTSES